MFKCKLSVLISYQFYRVLNCALIYDMNYKKGKTEYFCYSQCFIKGKRCRMKYTRRLVNLLSPCLSSLSIQTYKVSFNYPLLCLKKVWTESVQDLTDTSLIRRHNFPFITVFIIGRIQNKLKIKKLINVKK